MSNDALTWAWRAPIESGPKFVLVALADHGSDHSGEDWTCFPSIERLTQRTGMSDKTVRRHLEALEAGGWISRVRRRNGQRLGIYDYRLHRERLSEALAEVARAKACAQAVRLTGRGEPVNLAACTGQIGPALPVKLTGQEPSGEPKEEPTTGAREPGDEGFEEGFSAYHESGRRRTDVPKARAAWALAAGVVGEGELIERVRRYTAGDADLKTGKHGARAFERWLTGEVWRQWAAASPAACAAVAHDLPAEVAQALEAGSAYLHGARWVEADRTVVTRTRIAAERLVERVGPEALTALGLTIRHHQPQAVGG